MIYVQPRTARGLNTGKIHIILGALTHAMCGYHNTKGVHLVVTSAEPTCMTCKKLAAKESHK